MYLKMELKCEMGELLSLPFLQYSIACFEKGAQNVEVFEGAQRIALPFLLPHLSPDPIEK